MNDRMKFVFRIVHRYGGFIPIHQQLIEQMKRHHIPHRKQVRPYIANHYFDIITDAVIDFANTSAAFVANRLFGREIMKTNIINIATTKRKSDTFLHRNRGFGQCQPNVSRSTYEDNFVFLG
ncbi:MAG: hypothetical protein EBU66_17940 [Bacteroidetes bacterium]|nr:hypothetical protein [Bacteroidota bacterium]